jgi:hypothetical protein
MGIMRALRSFPLSRVLPILAALVIWKVIVSVLIEYRNYIPPDFESDFLRGRERYFYGPYGWAFYAHLVAGPLSLMLGTVLVSGRMRRAAPSWHGCLGRVEAVCVLLLLAPSGLWMARHALGGSVSTVGLGSLALATAACAVLGWRSAIGRRLADHRRWMWRTFILLCSAVVIRLTGGLAEVAQIDALWLYPVSTWTSWLVPLIAFELLERFNAPGNRVAAGR